MKTRTILLAASILPATLHGAEAVPAAGEGVLEEIVVTAQKREESLQQTPVAVTAITAQTIKELGIASVADLGSLAPGFSYSQEVLGGRGGLVSIRGIPTPADPMGTLDTTIGMYIDGVYLARPTQMVADLLDLERIEILRGPQGTLFGRNTTGGAVSFVTRAPQEEFGFGQTLGGGSRDLLSSRSVLHTGALLDGRLAATVTYLHAERDGVVDNVNVSDADDPGAYESDVARLAVRLMPSENLTLDYAYDWSDTSNVPGAFQLFAAFPYVADYLASSPRFGGSAVDISDERRASLSLDERSTAVQDDLEAHALTVTADFAAFTLKSVSAYRDSSHDTPANNLDGLGPDVRGLTLDPETFEFAGINEIQLFGGYDSADEQDQFQQELTLISRDSGPWEWTAGVFYFEESTDSSDPQLFTFVLAPEPPVLPIPIGLPLSSTTAYSSDAQSFAVYGQTTYRPQAMDDRLGVTVGARYSWDERSLSQDEPFVNEADASYSEPTGHVSLDYRLSEQSTAYLRLSHGYRSGGFNVRTLQDAFDPEYIDQLELGVKTDLLDDRLRLNGAVYTSRYEDQQISRFGVDLAGGAATIVENAGRSEYNGAELEMTALLSDALVFTAGAGFVDVDIEDVEAEDGSNIADEYKPANTPSTTAQAALEYRVPLGGIGDFSARLEWLYEDGFRFFGRAENTFNELVNRESRELVNARIRVDEIELGSSGWTLAVSAWGRNLTDEIYRARAIDFGPLGYAGVVFSEPRMYGVDVRAEFR